MKENRDDRNIDSKKIINRITHITRGLGTEMQLLCIAEKDDFQ